MLAVPAILAGISVKKTQDQKEEERAEAQKMIDQLMAQERADEAQGQADADTVGVRMTAEVSETIKSWETVYNVRSDYEQFVTHWQRNGLTQSSNVTFELGYATAELSFLSAYLRGHTMEAIRQAKLHEGSTSSITPDNDKFLATLTRAKDHLSKAKQSAQNIRDQTQSLSAVLADIDNGFLVPLFGNLVTWTNATNVQITALQKTVKTASEALATATDSRKRTMDDIASHFKITFGDVVGGIASIFVGSINDGWQGYIENTRSTLSQINRNINQAKRTQVIAQAKLGAYVPLVQEVNDLQKKVADNRQKVNNVEKALIDLDAKINDHFLSVQDAVELFKLISNPEKEYTTTAKLVCKMAQAITDMLDIDFGSLSPLITLMLVELKQVNIPAPDLSGVAREHASSPGVTEADAKAAVQKASERLENARSNSLRNQFALSTGSALPIGVEERDMQQPAKYQGNGLMEIERVGVDKAYTP